MNSNWRVATAIAGGAVVTWFLTFLVEWHIRTDWQQHWADGAIKAWANFAMLEWLYDYQTMVAAVLALGGIGIVFLQRHWQMNTETARRKEEALHVLNWTMIALKNVGELIGGGRTTAALQDLARLRETLPAIAKISPGLADNVRIAIDTLALYLTDFEGDLIFIEDNAGGDIELTGPEYASALGILWAGFFENSARLFDQQGKFRFVRQDRSVAQRWLPNMNVHPHRFVYMAGFYD